MVIRIDKSKLKHFADFNPEKGIFSFEGQLYENFAEDLYYGAFPTSYLISGYRGVGKSSFILYLKDSIRKLVLNEVKNVGVDRHDVVFVDLNVSSYQSRVFLIRQLVRTLYFSISDNKKYKAKRLEKDNVLTKQLESLFDRTSHDTYTHIIEGKEKTRGIYFNFKLFAFLSLLFSLLISCDLIIISEKFKSLFVQGGIVTSLIIYVAEGLNLSISSLRKENEEFSRKTIFDEEIADYQFLTLLKLLRDNDFRIIFVLDEIDKLPIKDANLLIKEIKPFLVSGNANFIIVSGQKLYFNYDSSDKKDDPIIGSVFTRAINIPLITSIELLNAFKKIVIHDENNLTENHETRLDNYIYYLIFKSNRISRKFISIIRSLLKYENGEAQLEIPDDIDFSLYSKIVKSIDRVYEKYIFNEFDNSAYRDKYINFLFRMCHFLLSNLTGVFKIDTFKEANGASTLSKYEQKYLTYLLFELEKNNVLKVKNAALDINNREFIFKDSAPIFDIVDTSSNKSPDNILLKELYELKLVLTNVYRALVANPEDSNFSTIDYIQYFEFCNVISAQWKSNTNVSYIFNNFEKYSEEDGLQNIEELFRQNKIDIGIYIRLVLNYFVYIKCLDFFSKLNYIEQNSLMSADQSYNFVFENSQFLSKRVFVDVKYLKGVNLNYKELILSAYEHISSLENKSLISSYILFIITDQNQESIARIEHRFRTTLISMDVMEDRKDLLKFYPISIANLKRIDTKILEYKNTNIEISDVFNLKNPLQRNSNHDRTDSYIPKVFELKKFLFNIAIRPKDVFWRFGIQFSKDGVFPPNDDSGDRHRFSDKPYLVISSGKASKENGGDLIWYDPWDLYFDDYFEGKQSQLISSGYQGGEVELEMYLNKENVLQLKMESNSWSKEFNFDIGEYKYCRFSAWADQRTYNMEVDFVAKYV